MADGTVNLPLVGNQRKEYLVVGALFATGYIVYRYRKAKTAPATVAAGAANTGLVPAGQDASGNEVYYNAAGQLVDAQGNPDTLASSVSAGLGTGYTNPAPLGAVGTSSTTTSPQTDEQWTAAVENDLEGIGYDPQTIATAIAQFLAKQPLTAQQVMIIRTAFAYEGHPPQNPSLPIITGGAGGGPTGGGGLSTYHGGNPPQSSHPPVAAF
jgi:hypothetical protein